MDAFDAGDDFGQAKSFEAKHQINSLHHQALSPTASTARRAFNEAAFARWRGCRRFFPLSHGVPRVDDHRRPASEGTPHSG
jgi:hypothetical protein